MKERKGNKKSVSTMLGMSTVWNPEQRAQGDYYTTDPVAVERLLEKFVFNPGKIWECACGCGNISEVLISKGLPVISTDLYDRGYGKSGIDFLQSGLIDSDVRTIITNPPYSLSEEFILHALDILPQGGEFMALLNINYLSGKKRLQSIYSKGYLDRVYIFSNRIQCYKNNEITGHSSPVNYGWFLFAKPGLDRTTNKPMIYKPIIEWL